VPLAAIIETSISPVIADQRSLEVRGSADGRMTSIVAISFAHVKLAKTRATTTP
jgi:hypothetical protein